MAQYWAYLNNEVAGPYALEQLIRLRGFSRQTLVQVDNGSGATGAWISPAEIPELAHIFKAVDEQMASPTPAPVRKAPAKPVAPRPSPKSAPAPVTPHRAPSTSSLKGWVIGTLICLLLAGAIGGVLYWRQQPDVQGQLACQTLITQHSLPSSSLYSSLGHYFHEKQVKPRWEFERLPDGLYHASVSWYAPEGSIVYAFETNSQAQTVRGLNSAALRLLAEGFPAPVAKPKPAPKPVPSALFPAAIASWKDAVGSGDFAAVWGMFSSRKRSEMAKGGMSREGYIRLQTLTYKVDAGAKYTVLKTHQESDTQMLALVKQNQPGRPDIFVKQFWTFDHDEWKLDDDEKRAAPAAEPAPQTQDPAGHDPSKPTDGAKPVPAGLPGMN